MESATIENHAVSEDAFQPALEKTSAVGGRFTCRASLVSDMLSVERMKSPAEGASVRPLRAEVDAFGADERP
jgi:hypothetical protein